jgi:hypothetical protein
MILQGVTLTGADESIDPRDLWPISQKHPFVEWGILYGSRSDAGAPRYPGRDWRKSLHDLARARWHGVEARLSAHLCSFFVRDLVLEGKFTFGQKSEPALYQRIQLNFHAYHHPACTAFLAALRKEKGKEWIFQMDEVNDQLWKSAWQDDVRAVPLFDTSGGAGIIPDRWPAPIANVYCGYAGGLGPENLESQLRAIAHVAPGPVPVWVDMETRVRSDDDAVFDLDKCRTVLEIAAPFVGRRI